MDMENEMLEEGTAGEVVTPETETEESTEPAEAEGEKKDEVAERPAGKREQTHAERAKYKAARKQGEETGYDRAAKEFNAQIAEAGLIDPITNKPITTLAEFKEYSQRYKQQRITEKAKKEGKTVAQVEEEEAALELLRRTRREDDEKAEKAKKEQERRDWLIQDAKDFAESWPDVDLVKLEKDPRFRKFCGKRFGEVPAAELYADFLEVVGSAQESAAAKKQDKRERGTGAGGGNAGDVLSPKQRKELEDWNAAYPHMKMTEKEFINFR